MRCDMEIVTYNIDEQQVKTFLTQLQNIATVAHVNLANQQLSSRGLSNMPMNQSNKNNALDAVDRVMEAREIVAKVYQALNFMNDTINRDIIKLKYLFCLTYKEISERLALSESGIRKRIKINALNEFALAYGMFE